MGQSSSSPQSGSNVIPRSSPTYQKVLAAFNSQFGADKSSDAMLFEAFAPGRINLIGEHVDYMGGDVVPAAVNLGVYFIARENKAIPSHTIYSVNNKEINGGSWMTYLQGILDEVKVLRKGVAVPPLQVAFGGDVPIGSGMSSSAALCVSFLSLLREAYGLHQVLPDLKLALLARDIEIRYAKVNIGIMDQYISVFGQSGKFIRLNCDKLTHTVHSFDDKITKQGYSVILVNSMVKHKLGDDYNQIRNAMETCQKQLGKKLIQSTEKELETIRAKVQPEQYERALYVVQEVARTNAFVGKNTTDPLVLGALLNATHQGLSKQLKVSTEQLDFIQEVSVKKAGNIVAGGRVMGGGFGGCVLVLVKSQSVEQYEALVRKEFSAKFGGLVPEIYKVSIGGGAVAEKRRAGVVKSKL